MLVHGASGGVGLVAVALAKHLGGRVVATVHRDGAAALDAYGADDVVDTDVKSSLSWRGRLTVGGVRQDRRRGDDAGGPGAG